MSDFPGDSGFPKPPPPPPPPNMAPPSGYVPYGGQNVGAYANFRRIGGLAKTLRLLVMILIPVLAISAFLLLSVKGKAEDLINGDSTISEYNDSIAPYGLMSLLSGLLQLALFVLTIIWMFRMAKNQIELRRAGTWGPAWAIAGWFVPPCVLYVIPYLMFRDLWKASDPNSGEDWKRNPIGGIVHVWWVLFGLLPLAFISVTIGNININTSADEVDAAQDIIDSFNVTIGAAAVQVGAAIAFLMLITQLSARHKQTINEV